MLGLTSRSACVKVQAQPPGPLWCICTCKPRATVGDDVKQGFRQKTRGSKMFQENVPLPLRQLATIPVEKQGQMSKLRRLPAQRLVDKQVLRGGDEPLRAPQHMADAHVVVIHHTG